MWKETTIKIILLFGKYEKYGDIKRQYQVIFYHRDSSNQKNEESCDKP